MDLVVGKCLGSHGSGAVEAAWTWGDLGTE
jgi:hypothetical protein